MSDDLTPERVAQMFHEFYEHLAPRYGYKTRKASAVPWADVPENNRLLMIEVASRIAHLVREDEVAKSALWLREQGADANRRRSYVAQNTFYRAARDLENGAHRNVWKRGRP